MNNRTFHHVMSYVMNKPMCSKEQLNYEIDSIESKIQKMAKTNTDAYITQRH